MRSNGWTGRIAAAGMAGLLGLGGCSGKTDPGAAQDMEKAAMTLEVTSSAFAEGASIPRLYTGDGKDTSPPLAWKGAPAGTRSFVLISDDPDAPVGTWVHWVMYNIPADVTSFPEGIPRDETLPSGAVQGKNSWGRIGYGGPCPPSGTHRYFFKVYALDTVLDLGPGQTKERVLTAMKGHVLADGKLMGRYTRG